MAIIDAMNVTSQTPGVEPRTFAKVALPLPVATCFTYQVPKELQEKILLGGRVEVPFGKRILSGVVVEFAERSGLERIRPIRRLYDTYLPGPLLELTRWIASYYGCSVGEAAQAVLPPVLRKSQRKGRMRGVVCLPAEGDAGAYAKTLSRAPRQLALVELLQQSGGRAALETVVGGWGFKPLQVRQLQDKGIIEIDSGEGESPLASIDELVVNLNPDQERALERINACLSESRFSPLLLHGVTGSGKTELYLRAARRTLSTGGGCIVLVPEIGLIPQATERYRRVFGDQIAILHSRMTGPERFSVWQRIESGECRIVLGPRSAVFSPVRSLRLIIVDEEQDDSYKQEDKPRYHARNVALMRGKFEGLTVVMGSATPSVESFHRARKGRYQYLSLPVRVGGAALPEIHFVDMREAPVEGEFFSSYLLERLDSAIKQGHQSILFLNKRGHARFVQCSACGWVARCRSCDISLTYHRVPRGLKCHFCGYYRGAITRCDECGGARLRFAGAGTQRIELDLAAFFPGVGVLRMDADTTSGKEGHRRVLEEFSTGKYPVLIGTQMVTKGHHFPSVNLVGVLFAEESLNYPDFRAAERTFRQLTQVAGRAGRSREGGEVVIQTYVPDHQVFEHLRSHDYDGFMMEEIGVRAQLKYPPFSRIILASCSAPDQAVLGRIVTMWADVIRRRLSGKADVLGPVPPLVAKVKNRFREQLLIRGRLTDSQKAVLLEDFSRISERERGGRTVQLRWDVDPETFY
ncbi:MAG: primosomal protein N' [Candidatus Krumholzibacteriia bacterium]